MSRDGEPLLGDVGGADSRAEGRGQQALDAAQSAAKVVASLRVLAKNLHLYHPSHPAVLHAAADMAANVVAAARHGDPVEIEITDAGLAHRTVPLYEVNPRAADLIEICRAKKVGRILLRSALSAEEAVRFVSVLWQPPDGETDAEVVAGQLSQAQVAHAEVQASREKPTEPETVNIPADEPAERSGPRIEDPRLLYRSLVEAVKEIYAQAKLGAELPTQNARALCRDVAMYLAEDPASLLPLASARRYDDFMHTHPVNVCLLASSVLAGLSGFPVAEFALGALTFDVGEALLPEEVALIAHPLSPEEKDAFQEHPLRGAALVTAAEGRPKMAVALAFEHHVGADFQGFPSAKPRWRLNFLTLVLAVADRYDALTGPRPNHRILTPQEAFRQMDTWAGGLIDRAAFEAFLATVGPYPPGTWARTRDGELVLAERWYAEERILEAKAVTDQDGVLLEKPKPCRFAVPPRAPAPLTPLVANAVPLCALDYLYGEGRKVKGEG